MKRVMKWKVPIDGEYHEIGGGRVVLAHMYDRDNVWVWIEEDVELPDRRRPYSVKETGQIFNGSMQVFYSGVFYKPSMSGPFVWHLVGEKQNNGRFL